MAAPNASAVPLDTPITIKISVNDGLKKIKLPLRDLGAKSLPDKLRHVLGIKPDQHVIFERFSDSAGGFITLDPNNPQVFKTLIRAAKAKLKLRLKATVTTMEQVKEADIPEVAEVPAKPVQPLIVHSPVPPTPQERDSTAFGCRAVGSGIFQFREARASHTTLVDTDEAPVPGSFKLDNHNFFDGLAKTGGDRKIEPVPTAVISAGFPWSVFCNACNASMDDSHFHCGICDGGDYDLCEKCVASGKLCPGEGHWLIKRFIKDGKVINSTTERISPRMKKQIRIEDLLKKPVQIDEVEKQMPGAFAEDTKTLAEEPRMPTRTCNSCVIMLPEREFITCLDCDDFDLCIACHLGNRHGHHPAHGFKPANQDTVLPLHAEGMLSPGRSVRHNAICDGCDKAIYGVRHKCLNCPDWDYCGECVKNARHIHPRHRFAAIYQPIPDQMPAQVRHAGVYCDGPLCSGKKSYITGVRYKCAVCHNTDFCAACEAIPANHHNRTHPLIKFKMPVRNVSITTENEDLRGNVRMMGDRRPEPAQKSAATETTPVQQANAATQVQTMAEIKPTEIKREIKQEAQPIPVIKSEEPKSPLAEMPVPTSKLNAHFVHDSVADGTTVQPGARFTQIWTIKNPGPFAWPTGCSVRYVGGDNMLNVDNGHPASVSDIAEASESNVVGREVQIGEEVAFKVVLKAPVRTGKCISYWRVKAADGTPFGHRLWCDVVVKTPEVAQMSPIPAQPIEPLAQTTLEIREQQKHAQLAHMQAVRQQQHAMLRHQMEMMQKQQATAQQNAASSSNLGAPPAYSESNESLHTRLAAMRAEQQKRREQMVAQLAAKREAMHAAGQDYRQLPSPVMPAGVFNMGENDKLRKESAKQRVEYIKAKIMRTREEQRAKTLEMLKQNSVVSAEQKSAEETEKVKKIIEGVTKESAKEEQSEAAEEEKMEGSQMVFPKLDKESPASSTYQSAASSSTINKGKAAYVENEAGEVERSATPSVVAPLATSPVPAPVAIPESSVSSPTVEEMEFDDLSDDIEVLSATAGDASEDDGFLTDEEYDILDASDNETVVSK
ncbi:hypothetical protein B0A54_10772 [Friedmanniomyces endolithicus]|uniref:ZZ-type domain-containing protein n=1 Tax=Friedmanniomyces endolithicus TaxID=329885 RepID=A0A4U0UR68_9PEZI|nr:hypothetical protein LTS09_017477 [Friedmanniomyces endolithicus]TKA38481.1 hypothetical protein B0A54_10772 [Friedmanniomyces endolithicus]